MLRSTQKGFTLIEILVVIVIIAIAATFAALAVGDAGKDKKIKHAAERIAWAISLAQQQAMLQPATLGLHCTPTGYEFLNFATSPGAKKPDWIPLTHNAALNFNALPSGIRMSCSGNPPIPLVISMSGDMNAITITVGAENHAPSYHVDTQINGTVTMAKY